MAKSELIANNGWFVKSGGAIRGPFSEQVLLSMWERGRIISTELISADRHNWQPISILGGAFAVAAPNGNGTMRVNAGTARSEVQYFINLKGQTVGPLTSQALQERISANLLGPTDPVWIEGTPSWLAASQVPGLNFSRRRINLSAWLRSYQLLVAGTIFAGLCLIVVPAWYVLELTASRERALSQFQDDEQRNQESALRLMAAENNLKQQEKLKLEERLAKETQSIHQFETQRDSIQERIHERQLRKLDTSTQERELADVNSKLGDLRQSLGIIEPQMTILDTSKSQAGMSGIEKVIANQIQVIVDKSKQQIFDKIHPIGTAKSIEVNDVTITTWKHGNPTNRLEDVLQFTVRYTIKWRGPITEDGFTKVSETYDTEAQRFISEEILTTNGITNSDLNYTIGFIGGALLRQALENQDQQ